jgi:aldose 1-epimerase
MAEILSIKKPARKLSGARSNKTRSIKLVNFETGESVSILPNLGATVRELVLRCDDRLYSLLEFPLSNEDMIENEHFAGVKLIPFAGRITDATYRFRNNTYKLKVNSTNNFAIHGFFFQKPFQLFKTTVQDNAASVVLVSVHDGKTKGYPFRFEVRLTYKLEGGSFTCITEIRNTDTRPLPIGDGWHPYFKTIGHIRRLQLSLPPHAVVEVTPLKVATGAMRKPVTRRSVISMADKTLDSVFDFGKKRQRVTTSLLDRKLGLKVELWQDSGAGKYRYLILYRPLSGTSVAIEPWTSAPDAFNNNMGLITLRPGARFKAAYGVNLKKLRR